MVGLNVNPSARYGRAMIRNILFDLDGTLTDSADGITRCIERAIETAGQASPPRTELAACIGTPLRDIFERFLDTSDATRIDAAISVYRERFDRVGFSENRVYDGVRELLHSLTERGHSLFVATAKNQRDAKRVVDHFDLHVHFVSVCGVETDTERRDKSALVTRILAEQRIDPASAAMVGDRSTDMHAARHAGIRAIGAGWGYGSSDELRSAGADSIVTRPGDVLAEFQFRSSG